MTHAWSSDPGRDAAVRAEEDGRQSALPTLAEAIAAVPHPLPARVVGTHWADWEELRGERDAAIREREEEVATLRATLQATKSLAESCAEERAAGNGGCGACSICCGEAMEQRDAAICERDEAQARVAELEEASGGNGQGSLDGSTQAASGGEQAVAFTKQQRDAIHLAVSVLASVWNDGKQLYGEAIEALQSINFDALTASGGNHSANPNGSEQEPVAWGFFAEDGGMVHVSTFKPEPGTATVVPLYRLPSPPRGWLTGKERTTLAGVVGLLRDLAKVCGRAAASRCELTAVAVEALLARSTPPEVVLKDFPPDTIRSVDSHYLAGWDQCMALAKKALAAAGVTVNEVGT